MKETKPVSFRLDIDVANSFKEMAEKNGFTQTQALEALISNFEVQKAKDTLIDRKKEIESFENYASKLVNIYLNSLELNVAAEDRIREDLKKELSSKDEYITTLLNKEKAYVDEVAKLKELISDKDMKINELLEEKNHLKEEVKEKQETINNQREQIAMLNSSVSKNKEIGEEYIAVKAENTTLKKALEELKLESREILIKYEGLKDNYSTLKENNNSIKSETIEYKEEIQKLKEFISKKEEAIKEEAKITIESAIKERETLFNVKLEAEKVKIDALTSMNDLLKDQLVSLKTNK